MRIPFAVWSGVLAVLVYAGLLARDFMNFGTLEFRPVLLGMVAGGWLALVILVGFAGMIRKAMTSRPADVPMDVAREIDRHPEH